MSAAISTEEGLCIAQYDLSGVSSNFGFSRSVEIKEKVCFPDLTQGAGAIPTKSRLVGPESSKVTNNGYLDQAINLAAAEAAISTYPPVTKLVARAVGSKVYMFVGAESSFDYGDKVGEIIPFNLELANTGPVHPGILYYYGNISASGNSTSQTVPAVSTGKTRCLHVHVVTATGTGSLALIYETSASGDFTDAVTRHTFATITAPTLTSERALKTALVTDTHGRFKWTLTGTGTFTVRFSEGVR